MLSRTSFARVTSDQHQSGHGSTMGWCVESGRAVVERCSGNAAVVDVHDPCAGGFGKLGRVVVPCLPRREVSVDEHAQLRAETVSSDRPAERPLVYVCARPDSSRPWPTRSLRSGTTRLATELRGSVRHEQRRLLASRHDRA
jgi:hypothetical protein